MVGVSLYKMISYKPITSLGHQLGRRVFWGAHFFKLCSTHFSRWGRKNLLWRGFAPCAP